LKGGLWVHSNRRRPIIAKAITRADSALISDNLTTTSQIVAEKFGKQHKDVLRKIETLEVPTEYHKRNFAPMVHDVNIGSGAVRQDKSYNLTRDGFALLVMGFTGKRAMAWKIRFLEAFNGMEARLKSGTALISGQPATDQPADDPPRDPITWALTRPVSADLRIVLAEIARRASPGSEARVSLNTLAMSLCLHGSTLRRRVAMLAAQGLIDWQQALRAHDAQWFRLAIPLPVTGPAPAFPQLMNTRPGAPDDRPVTWAQLRLMLHDAAMGQPPDPTMERLFNLFCRYQDADWTTRHHSAQSEGTAQ
jgi:Rha family phage regulatory protein